MLFLWEVLVGSAASSFMKPALTPLAAFHIRAMPAMSWDITVNLIHLTVASNSVHAFLFKQHREWAQNFELLKNYPNKYLNPIILCFVCFLW